MFQLTGGFKLFVLQGLVLGCRGTSEALLLDGNSQEMRSYRTKTEVPQNSGALLRKREKKDHCCMDKKHTYKTTMFASISQLQKSCSKMERFIKRKGIICFTKRKGQYTIMHYPCSLFQLHFDPNYRKDSYNHPSYHLLNKYMPLQPFATVMVKRSIRQIMNKTTRA